MSFTNLDLNLLRVFDAVMTELNLTRAADRLATTQPAVSNALKRLRYVLDDELFIRTAHGVKPTARALALRPAVRSALETLEAAIGPEKSDLVDVSKTLRLCMADSTAARVLPPLIPLLKRAAPRLTLQILPLLSRDPRESLIRGEIDLAVGSFPGIVAQIDAEQEVDSGICHDPLYSGEYVCVMRKDHPLARQELTLDRYCEADHVLVNFSGRMQGQADKLLAAMGRERRIVLTVNQFTVGAQIAAASDLLTIIPIQLIATTRMDDLLTWTRLPFALPPLRIDMLWHEREVRDLAHRWLRGALQEITNDLAGA
ncbi:LysR family transcriptional regulator [Noviherbaspirillum pedocola]|uniref:LysR family transcriptional regulator n=1 Tax=Noviherbaspirillum pedocola TaxID=2801341 RepID=A0A934W7X9_9BURK|nr:LysR family transcriptional regulator [Noviherbaspirillum pedocola]MBK4735174.1 LysR family transcriptional regulator [Noviherbaspirillum pedocola]